MFLFKLQISIKFSSWYDWTKLKKGGFSELTAYIDSFILNIALYTKYCIYSRPPIKIK